MKDIVCDKCGEVVLLPDEGTEYHGKGIHRLYSYTLLRSLLERCDECANNLIEAVRKE